MCLKNAEKPRLHKETGAKGEDKYYLLRNKKMQ
jgi:hypothetical protein